MVLKCVGGAWPAMTPVAAGPGPLPARPAVPAAASTPQPGAATPGSLAAAPMAAMRQPPGRQEPGALGSMQHRRTLRLRKAGRRAWAPCRTAATPAHRPRPCSWLCSRARRTQTCRFSGLRIYPGKGVLFIRVDGQVRSSGASQQREPWQWRSLLPQSSGAGQLGGPAAASALSCSTAEPHRTVG